MGVKGQHFPAKWNERKIETAYLLALLGATNQQMADAMEVSLSTLQWWMRERPEFGQAVSEGKLGADTKVVKALYSCATGYDYEEEVATYDRPTKSYIKTTVKRHRPADTWAALKILATRHREQWSETHKVEFTQTNNVNFNINILSTEELTFLEEIAKKQLPSAGDINESNT